jgi:hypothetical protein
MLKATKKETVFFKATALLKLFKTKHILKPDIRLFTCWRPKLDETKSKDRIKSNQN